MQYPKDIIMNAKVNARIGESKPLQKTSKPSPSGCKLIFQKKKQGILPSYLYSSQQLKQVKCYTLLMIGGTESGKTAFLDGLLNKMMGIQYFDNWRYKLVDQTPLQKEQIKVQTQNLKTYYIKDPANKFNIRIIDLPKLDEAQGSNSTQLKNKIKYQLYEIYKIKDKIDYILFFNKASNQKLSQESIYIYREIQNILSRQDVRERFLLMCTDAQKGANPKCLPAFKAINFTYIKYFCFNTGQLFNSQRLREDNWNFGMECFDQLIKYILKENKQPLNLFGQNLNQSNGRYFQYCSIEFKEYSIKKSAIQIKLTLNFMQKKLQQLKLVRVSFMDSVQEIHQTNLIKKKQGYFQMCSKCNVTCCEVCRWPDNEPMSKCTYFNNGGLCPKCPGRCPRQVHKRTSEFLQIKIIHKIKNNPDSKKKFQQGVVSVRSLKNEILQMIFELDKMIDIIWRCVAEMKDNAQKEALFKRIIEQEKLTQQEGRQDRVKFLQNVFVQIRISKNGTSEKSPPQLIPQIAKMKYDCMRQIEQTQRFIGNVVKN